jgi:hypothetical protein
MSDYERIAEIGRLRAKVTQLERERDTAHNDAIQIAANVARDTPPARDVVAEILKLFR